MGKLSSKLMQQYNPNHKVITEGEELKLDKSVQMMNINEGSTSRRIITEP